MILVNFATHHPLLTIAWWLLLAGWAFSEFDRANGRAK